MSRQKMSYQEAVNEIEQILHQIESGELDVDKLTEKAERVSSLIRFCKAKLKSTEEEISSILGDVDEEKEE
jgi:exodeoxyribonuclease VII small subunit